MADKKLEEYSEEELAGMTDDQLAELANAQGNDDSDGDGVVAGEDDVGSTIEGYVAKGAKADDADLDPAGAPPAAGDDALTKDALQLLLDEGDENGMVPLARLNEVLANDRRKTELLELLIGAGRVGTSVPPDDGSQEEDNLPEFLTYDFRKAQREYIALITSGDEDGAIAKSEEIEDTRDKVNAYKLDKVREEAIAEADSLQTTRSVKSEIAVAEADIYKAYAFLDNSSPDANEAAILAVNAKAKQLIAAGTSPAAALRKAGADIGSMFAKVLKGAAPAAAKGDEKKPAVDARNGTATGDQRVADALKRGLAASQPETLKTGIGNLDRTATLDINKLSDTQLDWLEKNDPEALAELRGDNRVS